MKALPQLPVFRASYSVLSPLLEETRRRHGCHHGGSQLLRRKVLAAEKNLKTQRGQRTAAEDAEKLPRWRSDFSRLRRDRRHTRFLDWETSILYMSPPLPRYASSIEAACELNKNSSLSMFQLTDRIIGAAIKVHSRLGPGLLESAYESCVAYELDSHGIRVIRQKAVPLIYEW